MAERRQQHTFRALTTSMTGLLIGLSVGCAAHRQTNAELLQALDWFVPSNQRAAWRDGSVRPAPLPRLPVVAIVWAPKSPADAVETAQISKADREQWMASLQGKLEHSGVVSRVVTSTPDLFAGGLALEGIRTLGREQTADLLLVFNLEHDKRRYNVTRSYSVTRPDDASGVVNVVQVLATARVVGVTPTGFPIFFGSAIGYDEGLWNMEDVADVSNRVAIEGLSQEIVRHLREIDPIAGRGEAR